jgi:hypothetical protein
MVKHGDSIDINAVWELKSAVAYTKRIPSLCSDSVTLISSGATGLANTTTVCRLLLPPSHSNQAFPITARYPYAHRSLSRRLPI